VGKLEYIHYNREQLRENIVNYTIDGMGTQDYQHCTPCGIIIGDGWLSTFYIPKAEVDNN
jgi:hypothetical protein